MPLKLVPPRKGKSPNWTIRGTYLRVGVDQSSGTNRRPVARSILKELERQIERGEYPPRETESQAGAPTFLSAAVAYMEAGRRPRHRRSRGRITSGRQASDAEYLRLHSGRGNSAPRGDRHKSEASEGR